MKITTYNPDGSIKEVREHRVQVPKYIKTFDAKHSFLNITEDDVALVQFKRKDFDKDLLLNQYRFLLRYDYDNYLKSNACKIYIEDEQGRMNNEDTMEYYDHLMSVLLRTYTFKSPHQYPRIEQLSDEVCRFLNDSLLIDTLLYHAKKTKNRIFYSDVDQEQSPLTKNLIGIIHRLYYALRKANELGHLGENEQKIMYSLFPFANVQTSKLISSALFDNDIVLAKIIKSMYLTRESCRDSIYSLAYAIESSVQMEASYASNVSVNPAASATSRWMSRIVLLLTILFRHG